MFPQKLKNLRRDRGLSQGELSKVFSVAQQTVGKWESGLAYPNIDTLKQIAKYFNVSIDYLLDNDGAGANANTQPPLNAEQAELIAEYDALNDEGRGLIRGMLGSLRLTHGKSGRSMGYGNVAGNKAAAAMKG